MKYIKHLKVLRKLSILIFVLDFKHSNNIDSWKLSLRKCDL